jgi:hypothetical protein
VVGYLNGKKTRVWRALLPPSGEGAESIEMSISLVPANGLKQVKDAVLGRRISSRG